jgi:hypothetical protein
VPAHSFYHLTTHRSNPFFFITLCTGQGCRLRPALSACECVSVVYFLVITPRTIITSKQTLTLLHITLPKPITSLYLDSSYLTPPFDPAAYSCLLISSHFRSAWYFRGLIPPLHRNEILVAGIARNSVENCCGQLFCFELHTSTISFRTAQQFLLGTVGLRIRCTSIQLRVISPLLRRFNPSLPQHQPAAAKRRHYETAGYTVPFQNSLCLNSATSRLF